MSAPTGFLSVLGPVITSYLTLKRALGMLYANEERILGKLDGFLAAIGADAELTSVNFSHWCASLGHLASGVQRERMRVVRNLCLYRQRSDPTCYVPDLGSFPRPHEHCRPHLFSEREIVALLEAAKCLSPHTTSPLRREVYRLAVVLLYTTGMRRGELVRLTIDDYDPSDRTVFIGATKFHKSRLLPLSVEAEREIESFLLARRRLPHPSGSPLLVNLRRGLRPYTGPGIHKGLRRLFRAAGVRTASGDLPRVHDMRHSFAHQALLRWYRKGADVQAKLPLLSTYMGHVSVASTLHYLSFFQPFAEVASERFERHCALFLDEDDLEGGR